MVAAKPDCTGQKFGYLTVLGKTDETRISKHNGKPYRLWLLRCVCGKKIKLRRGDFDRNNGKGQKSCGCKYRRHPKSNQRQCISGKRFGWLTPIAPIPGKRLTESDRSIVWLCQCDCGNRVKKSVKRLNAGWGLHCGEKNEFHLPYKKNYPATPKPYPKEAGVLVEKYLYLTKHYYWRNSHDNDLVRGEDSYNAEIEDERRDRLLRAAWIVIYRRSQSEDISALKEMRLIKKHLFYCQIDVFSKHNEVSSD